jgi:hypothetical protein
MLDTARPRHDGGAERDQVTITVLAGREKGRSRRVEFGQAVTFGRGNCDLRILNPIVSRHHGTVFVGPGFVTVTCASSTYQLWIDRGDGYPTAVHRHRTTVIDQENAAIHLRMAKPNPAAPEHDQLFGEPALGIYINPNWIAAHHPAPFDDKDAGVRGPNSDDAREAPTVQAVPALRERREFPVLVALCASMFDTDSRRTDVPSVNEITALLEAAGAGLSPGTVRNYLSGSRALLGLDIDDDTRRIPRLALMALAVQSGVVTEVDVAALRARAVGARRPTLP